MTPLRGLPLVGTVLLPYLVLLVLLASGGTYVLSAALAESGRTALDRELSSRSLQAAAVVRERELYLLEAATFAANVEGMADAVAQRRDGRVDELLGSVRALKGELSVAVVLDAAGRPAAQQAGGGGRPGAVAWARLAPVRAALDGRRSGALLALPTGPVVVLAAPLCRSGPACARGGAVVVGLPAARLVDVAGAEVGLALLDRRGVALARSSGPVPALSGTATGRRALSRDGDAATVRLDVGLQGTQVGQLAVTVPTGDATGAVVPAVRRLVVLVVGVLVAAVVVGVLLSRSLVRRVRTLVRALDRLGDGELAARVDEARRDELGQVAAGVDAMADRLQEGYELLEQRVEERTAEVQRLLRERTEFFASLTHELRTPVAVVLTQAQLLADPSWRPSRAWQRECGQLLQSSGEQLLEIVRDVLDLARAQAGHLEVDVEPVDLGALLTEVEPTVVGLAVPAGLAVMVDAAPLPPVLADPARLRQVLLGLVDNAVKYTPDGGSVVVRAHQRAGDVVLTVQDSGVGVPEADRERVFTPFTRVAGTRTQRGEPSTGLGLAVARRLVEAQGGTIALLPAPGGGTVAEVALPVLAVPGQAAGPASAGLQR